MALAPCFYGRCTDYYAYGDAAFCRDTSLAFLGIADEIGEGNWVLSRRKLEESDERFEVSLCFKPVD